jgi:hypothetical protein
MVPFDVISSSVTRLDVILQEAGTGRGSNLMPTVLLLSLSVVVSLGLKLFFDKFMFNL